MYRRSFLQVGTFAGVSLAEMLYLKAEQQHYDFIPAKAESVIHIFLPGGIAHQESFDPKPYAPLEYRGDVQVVKTKTGDILSNRMPNLASISDKFALIRSMTHGEAAHERGTHNMFTGYKPSPALVYPSFGSVISHEYGSRNNLPPYVCVPNSPNEFANSGYLSSSFKPFNLNSDPANPNFKVLDLNLSEGSDLERFNRRRASLETLNTQFASKHNSDKVVAMDKFYEQAYSLINSQNAREAFNLGAESEQIKERYGKNEAGQRMLMARRLVEAGVRMVTMTYGGWDMHTGITGGMNNLMPAFDKALAALLTDLEERGMLSKTLVMVSSEFGRTPKINKDAGRDHWSKVFSVLLAGGGTKGGLIYGSSDPTASDPENNPTSPEDLAYTMYHLLGIVGEKELMSSGDRPIEIIDGGKLIKDIVV